MIQRKQTLFLLFAVVAIVVCLFLPIAGMASKATGSDSLLYNLGVACGGDLGFSFVPTCLPLFLLLTVSACVSLVNIFMYKNLNLQKTLCSVALLFGFLWYVDYALMFLGIVVPISDTAQTCDASGGMSLKFAACLPLVAIVLLWMAKKGVGDDIKLLKAADRIR